MVLMNLLKNLVKGQVNSQVRNYEQEMVNKLAQSDAMKAAATFAHELVTGQKNRYDPNDPRTWHLKDEDGTVPPVNPVLQKVLAAKAAVEAAGKTLVHDIKSDLNKRVMSGGDSRLPSDLAVLIQGHSNQVALSSSPSNSLALPLAHHMGVPVGMASSTTQSSLMMHHTGAHPNTVHSSNNNNINVHDNVLVHHHQQGNPSLMTGMLGQLHSSQLQLHHTNPLHNTPPMHTQVLSSPTMPSDNLHQGPSSEQKPKRAARGKYKCHTCGGKGHTSRTCPHAAVSIPGAEDVGELESRRKRELDVRDHGSIGNHSYDPMYETNDSKRKKIADICTNCGQQGHHANHCKLSMSAGDPSQLHYSRMMSGSHVLNSGNVLSPGVLPSSGNIGGDMELGMSQLGNIGNIPTLSQNLHGHNVHIVPLYPHYDHLTHTHPHHTHAHGGMNPINTQHTHHGLSTVSGPHNLHDMHGHDMGNGAGNSPRMGTGVDGGMSGNTQHQQQHELGGGKMGTGHISNVQLSTGHLGPEGVIPPMHMGVDMRMGMNIGNTDGNSGELVNSEKSRNGRKLICPVCKAPGHFKKTCPQRVVQMPVEEAVLSAVSIRDVSPSPFVSVRQVDKVEEADGRKAPAFCRKCQKYGHFSKTCTANLQVPLSDLIERDDSNSGMGAAMGIPDGDHMMRMGMDGSNTMIHGNGIIPLDSGNSGNTNMNSGLSGSQRMMSATHNPIRDRFLLLIDRLWQQQLESSERIRQLQSGNRYGNIPQHSGHERTISVHLFPPSMQHWPVRIQFKSGRKCKHCSRTRGPDDKRKHLTKWMCRACNTPLCLSCFEAYHSEEFVVSELVNGGIDGGGVSISDDMGNNGMGTHGNTGMGAHGGSGMSNHTHTHMDHVHVNNNGNNVNGNHANGNGNNGGPMLHSHEHHMHAHTHNQESGTSGMNGSEISGMPNRHNNGLNIHDTHTTLGNMTGNNTIGNNMNVNGNMNLGMNSVNGNNMMNNPKNHLDTNESILGNGNGNGNVEIRRNIGDNSGLINSGSTSLGNSGNISSDIGVLLNNPGLNGTINDLGLGAIGHGVVGLGGMGGSMSNLMINGLNIGNNGISIGNNGTMMHNLSSHMSVNDHSNIMLQSMNTNMSTMVNNGLNTGLPSDINTMNMSMGNLGLGNMGNLGNIGTINGSIGTISGNLGNLPNPMNNMPNLGLNNNMNTGNLSNLGNLVGNNLPGNINSTVDRLQ